jgi:hypothetical protein
MVMNKQLMDCLISDGVTQCKNILEDKVEELRGALPDGKFFFKGCMEGFELSRKLICLEQFEQFIIHMKNEEEADRKGGVSYNEYITGLGKRCALEFIYNALSSSR